MFVVFNCAYFIKVKNIGEIMKSWISVGKIGVLSINVAVFVLLGISSINAYADACWKSTYGRGVGKIPTNCSVEQVKSGLLCYPKQDGYKVVAGVAWQNCPANYKDTGGHCLKPAAYGRGAGYVLWDEGKCNRENPQGCEKNGLIWYPKCKAGFHNVGCCVCSPDCPAGMTDIGVSCQKKSHIVETILPQCPAGQENDAGLCYPKCKLGSKGVGPVCWGECREGMVECAGTMCAASKEECQKVVIQQVLSVAEVAVKVAAIVASGGSSLLANLGEGLSESNIEKIETERAAKKELQELAKKVRNEVLDEFGVGMNLEQFEKEVVDRLSAQAPELDKKIVVQLAKTAAKPDESNTKKLVDTIASYDPTGLGIGRAIKSFNLEICK